VSNSPLVARTTPRQVEVIESLDQLSFPPSDEELSKLRSFAPNELPQKYQRENFSRVFVNRSLRLDRIKWIGFDMDYTLAVYKEPVFESLTYDIAVKRLITMGYPESIRELKVAHTIARLDANTSVVRPGFSYTRPVLGQRIGQPSEG